MELLLFVFEMKEGELLSKKWCEMLFAYYDKRFGAYELRATTGFRYACGLGVVLLLTLSMTIPCFIVWLVNPEIPKGTMPSMSTVTRMEGVKLKEARLQPQTIKTVTTDQENQPKKTLDAPGKLKTEMVFKPDITLPEPVEKEVLTEKVDETLPDKDKLEIAKALEQTDGVIVDSIPHYPTGLRDFMHWLDKNVVYPASCVRNHIEGTVEVAFIVEPDGNITDMRILKGADERLNHEAIRVMQCMPNWIPAKKNGKAIKAQVTLPIVFEIND